MSETHCLAALTAQPGPEHEGHAASNGYQIWVFMLGMSVAYALLSLFINVFVPEKEGPPVWTHLIHLVLHAEIFRTLIVQEGQKGPFVVSVGEEGIRVHVHAVTVLRLYSRFPVAFARWSDISLDKTAVPADVGIELMAPEIGRPEHRTPRRLYVDRKRFMELARPYIPVLPGPAADAQIFGS